MKNANFRILSVFFLALFLLMLGTGLINAQSAANYSFTTVTTGSLADMSTGTTDIFSTGTHSSNISSAVLDIGFPFVFMGQEYTQFSINSNGQMRMGSTVIGGAARSPAAGVPLLAPISGSNTIRATGKAHYKVTGTAPGRTLIVEWTDVRIPAGTAAEIGIYSRFQVLLSEATGSIEYRYGNMFNMSTAQTRGVYFSSGISTGQIGEVTTITGTPAFNSSSTTLTTTSFDAFQSMQGLNGAVDGNRRVFTFTPPPAPAAPTGLNFTSVGALGMTLNWTDNASTESFYRIDRSTDGITYATLETIAANSSTYSATGLTPGTTYHWRVIAGTEGKLSPALEGSRATSDASQITSIATGNWGSTSTWSTGTVPTQYDNVVIAGTHTVTINDAASCYDLTVSNGATLIYETATARTLTVNRNAVVTSGGVFTTGASGSVTAHSLLIHGNLTNNGTLDFSTNANTAGATITFTGTAFPTVELTLGASSTTDFRNSNGVTLDKGSNRNQTLTFSPGGTLTVQGATTTGFLTISNGYFILGGTGAFSNPLFSTAAYSIPASGGLWLNNSNATIVGLNGSSTMAGLLRISGGSLNIGTAGDNSMGFSSGAIITIEGGAVNSVARFGVAAASNAITYTQSGGTVTLNTLAGNTSNTIASFDMGTSISTSFTMSGGTVILQRGTGSGDLRTELRGASTNITANINITGGTFQLGNASTPASTTFNIAGVTPNLVVNGTNNPNVVPQVNIRIHGDLTFNGSGTFYLLSSNNLDMRGQSASNPGNITNYGTMRLNESQTQSMSFTSSFGIQTFTNNGTITANTIPSLTINNTFSGGTVTLPSNLFLNNGTTNAASLTLTAGTLIATGLTLGSGGTVVFWLTRTNGSLQNSPTFNFGSGTVNYTYNGTTQQTPGHELTSTISGRLTINNIAGVLLNSPLSVGSLTLTSGILTTSDGNLLTVTGSISGGSATTYVNGPLVRRLPASLTSGTYTFPVGKGGSYNPLALIAPNTTSGGTVDVKVEVFAANSGGQASTGLSSVNTDRYWHASITAGAANFTSSQIRLTDATVQNGRKVGLAATANGSYTSIGGLASGTALTSDATATLGYFLIGTTDLTFSGSVNVGAGQTYTSLTGANGLFEKINSGRLTGDLTVNITSNLTEDGTNALGQWLDVGGTWTLTIRPDGTTERTISGAVANGMIRLDGADRVTIDGRYNTSGKYLRFRNTNTLNATITLINDACNNTIRDCYIEGATTASTNGVVFFSIGSTTGNDNNTVMNCVIRDRSDATAVPRNLIYSLGAFTPARNSGNTISGCELLNFTSTGILLASGNSGNENWTISENTIYQTASRSTTLYGMQLYTVGTADLVTGNIIRDLNSSSSVYGIAVGSAGVLTVSRNRIYSFTSTAGSTGFIYGIHLVPGSTTSLVNNQISIIPSYTNSQNVFGIFEAGNTGNVSYYYYNTVYIGGISSGNIKSYAYYDNNANSLNYLRNNAFINNRTRSEGATGGHFAAGHASNSAITTVDANNNLYIGNGPSEGLNFELTSTAVNFAAYKAAFGVGSKDIASYDVNAGSITLTNLLTDPATGNLNIKNDKQECWAVNGKGVALDGFADDYSATGVRSVIAGTSSDIGSDEFNPTGDAAFPPAATASGAPALSTTTTYTVFGKQVGSIAWGADGTVPGLLSFSYYSGSQAPPTQPGDRAYLYYDISQFWGSGFTYDITLWYDEGQLNGIAEADLRPAKSNDGGNTWTAYLTQGTGAGEYQINTTANTVTIYGLTDFSLFTLTSQSNPLPVQLSSFTSSQQGRDILLNWETQTEENANRFVIERKAGQSSDWSSIGEVQANGNSNSPKKYSYTDRKLNSGKYSYRLKMIDNDGTFEYSDVIESDIGLPKEYAISQNYPNPFNPTTKIDFQLPFDSRVQIELYNITGERVATLINAEMQAGFHTYEMAQTAQLSSGVYIYRIIASSSSQTSPFTAVKKMVLMK